MTPLSSSSQTSSSSSSASADVRLEAGHYGRTVIARLKPNEDIVEALERLCGQYGIGRAVVRSAVGSLIDGHLASGAGAASTVQVVKGPGVEIVGLFGEVSGVPVDGRALGASGLTAILSGTDSQVFAGRVVRGMNLSFITVEVTLQEWIPDAAGLVNDI
ncbi:PPC domain-containing DNA-binding protein [Paraburkholderia phenoliruptrix]|uniref:PPC domain-containing DNA-binding protein n=1 Tax=Paraburkholderia phenoliruptrix TaxID=252970 RepID=UPI001C4F4456|nr:PPC domain-containing DNA-binding protein [Paraburkholderia phenoliruptrix]MBW0447079.1 DNA-binding protein [Paraburkholderia phenoliruptrix]MBW9101065.1 DNA-binding protein [Paraburkholderia phenoliruptrix]